jgi:hypothetical protein
MIDAKGGAHPAVDRRNGTLYTAVRALVGGGSVVLGLYLGGMNVAAYEAEGNVSVFSGVVILGGMIMITQARRQPRARPAGWVAGTVVGAVGLLVSMVTPVQQICCDAVRIVRLGLPLPWTTGYGDTWSQAVGEAWRGTWDPVAAMLNAIFWAYAGMIFAVVIGLSRRARHRDSRVTRDRRSSHAYAPGVTEPS